MPMHKFNSLKRWGMTGLAGLMALTFAACGKIQGDGTSGNRAGKNFFIEIFSTRYDPDDTTKGNKCPPDKFLPYSSTVLNTSYADDSIMALFRNDSTKATTATAPENTVIVVDNIKVSYEVPGATAQIPSYDERVTASLDGGGDQACSVFHVFPPATRDFINKNRSAFPANETSSNYFQVRAKVKAQGYETNGGTRRDTPEALFTIHVYNY